jgi:hypothetical protein
VWSSILQVGSSVRKKLDTSEVIHRHLHFEVALTIAGQHFSAASDTRYMSLNEAARFNIDMRLSKGD